MIVWVLIGGVLLGLLCIHILYRQFWDYRLTAAVKFQDKTAFEGDKTALLEIVVNDKLLPLPSVEIDFHLNRNLRFTQSANSTVSDKLYRRDVFSLGSKKKITRTLELFCMKRGYYRLENLGFMANNLFMTRKYLKTFLQTDEFYVYPRRIPTEKIAIPFHKIMGETLSRNKVYDDPFAFGGIRDYRISDPMKYINWKASAKSGDLVVNLHDSSLSQEITVILDTFDSAAPIDDELNEECIRVVSALAERILASGATLSLFGNGFDLLNRKKLWLPSQRGTDSVFIRKSLSRLQWDDGESCEHVLKRIPISTNTLYVLVSKNVTDSICSEFARLSEKNSGLWILPYRDTIPSVTARKFKMLYWCDNHGN